MENVELTEEIKSVLEEYTRLQQQEQELKERKHALQEKLKAHLRGDAKKVWYPEIGGKRLKINYRSVSHVEYDEELLRTRLGDRYKTILELNMRKLKAELPNLGSELEPLLDRIGSPSAEKVKAAIESGVASPGDFRGAFTKTAKEYIAVATLHESEGESVD
ncbi:MAG: hypothetical protein K9M45_02785 [Kiritimatiellales bacterium]|nr:hypothetical protein [Kiritimatiellales bacterium]